MLASPEFRRAYPGWRISTLEPGDAAEIQGLCERCADYLGRANGLPPALFGAREIFAELFTPGPHPQRRWWGVRHPQDGLVALLDVVPDYGAPRSWCLVLILIAPSHRNRGLGEALLHELERHARAQGGRDVILAVLDHNEAAARFFQRLGYEVVLRNQPMPLGIVLHRARVMARFLDADRRSEMLRLSRGAS